VTRGQRKTGGLSLQWYQSKPSLSAERAEGRPEGLKLLSHRASNPQKDVGHALPWSDDTAMATLSGDWIVKIAILALSLSLVGRKFGIAITFAHMLFAFGIAGLIYLTWRAVRGR
jgi:hypothetical protein